MGNTRDNKLEKSVYMHVYTFICVFEEITSYNQESWALFQLYYRRFSCKRNPLRNWEFNECDTFKVAIIAFRLNQDRLATSPHSFNWSLPYLSNSRKANNFISYDAFESKGCQIPTHCITFPRIRSAIIFMCSLSVIGSHCFQCK